MPDSVGPETGHDRSGPQSPRIGRYYRSGLLSDLLSPEAALYFLAVLPQFVPRGWPPLPSMILLAALDGVLVLAWLSFLGCAACYATHRLQHPRFRKVTTVICGTSLIGLGAGVALTKI